MQQQEDIDLIARVLVEDDRDAFEALVKKYQSAIRALFRKLTGGDDILADDLSQETFISAYKGIKNFKGQAKFQTWLYAIAKNTYFQHYRNNPSLLPLESQDDESSNMNSDVKMDIAKSLLALDAEPRLLLSLSYADGLTQSELAELMEMPLGTVKTNILRAKEQLRDILKSYERSI